MHGSCANYAATLYNSRSRAFTLYASFKMSNAVNVNASIERETACVSFASCRAASGLLYVYEYTCMVRTAKISPV